VKPEASIAAKSMQSVLLVSLCISRSVSACTTSCGPLMNKNMLSFVRPARIICVYLSKQRSSSLKFPISETRP
jgi:hypothetical protein